MEKIIRNPWVLFVILLILLYVPIFAHLDERPLEWWDESRLAANAYEMSRTRNWLVTTFYYQPEMWNTKPPLLIWLEALSIKTLGPSILAIRIPSALAAFFTCMVLFWFFARKRKDPLTGLLACVILLCSEGYVRRHGIRTGDYEALLIFFSTSFVLTWFIYIEEENRKHFFAFIILVLLATLTKGVQPLIFLPPLFAYALYRRKAFVMLRRPYFYFGMLLFILVVSGYYLMREHVNPGYINAVIQNELGGRYLTVIENHKDDFWHYHKSLKNEYFRIWYYLVPFGVIIGMRSKDLTTKRLSLYLFLCSIFYLLVISSAATKLVWYELPVLPFLAILVSFYIAYVITLICSNAKDNYVKAAAVLPIILLIGLSYSVVFNQIMAGARPEDEQRNRAMAEYMHSILKGNKKAYGYQVTWEAEEQNIDWYARVLEDKGLLHIRSVQHLHDDSPIITHQQSIQQFIEENYSYKVIEQYDDVKVYMISRDSIVNNLVQ